MPRASITGIGPLVASFAIAVVGVAPAEATAQPVTVGAWTISSGAQTCVMSATTRVVLESPSTGPKDGGQAFLSLEPRSGGGFELTIDGVGVRRRMFSETPYAIVTGDMSYRAFSASSSARGMAGSRYRATIDPGGLAMLDGTPVTGIHERDATGPRVAVLKVPDVRSALQRFAACRLTANRPLELRRPAADIIGLGGVDGQPIGRVTMAVEVGASGLVGNCVVTPAGRDAALDAAICREVRSNARFTPATDATGKLIPARTLITVGPSAGFVRRE